MMYVIVRWTGEEYVIIHYSHDPEDAVRMYEHYLKKFGKIWLLVDERVALMHESRMQLVKLQKQLAESRKTHKDAQVPLTNLED